MGSIVVASCPVEPPSVKHGDEEGDEGSHEEGHEEGDEEGSDEEGHEEARDEEEVSGWFHPNGSYHGRAVLQRPSWNWRVPRLLATGRGPGTTHHTCSQLGRLK